MIEIEYRSSWMNPQEAQGGVLVHKQGINEFYCCRRLNLDFYAVKC
jgi:hypothetical protein